MGGIGIVEFIILIVMYPLIAMFTAVHTWSWYRIGFQMGRQVAAENHLQRS